MPRFLKASDIPMAKRKPHLDRYRNQLREALANPGLTSAQRARIKTKLATLGQPKPYEDLAKTEASVTAEVPPENPTPEAAPEAMGLDDLMQMTKVQLCALADERGVSYSSSWRKQQIAEALL